MFDPPRGATTPKARFAYLFPNARSAVIQVRLKPDLTEAQRRRAIELVRGAVAMKEWQLTDGASYRVTGAPVVVEDLAAALTDSLLRLLVVALLVMAVVLALVFRSRLRLLPLAVALAAVAITFGADVAARRVADDGLDRGAAGAARARRSTTRSSTRRASRRRSASTSADTRGGGRAHRAHRRCRRSRPRGSRPAVGFLVLLLSPVPMVRGFGVLLVAGIAIAFFLALSAGTAALVGRGAAARERAARSARSARGAAELVDDLAARVGRAARDRCGGSAARAREAMLRGALERPRRVLLIGLVIALAGLAVDSQTKVSSDLRELVPQDLRGARDLDALQRATGVAGEIDVVVEGRDLTDPAVVTWMRDYQAGLLKRYGYSTKNGCGKAALCPALSLPDLFRSADADQGPGADPRAARRGAGLLLAGRDHGGPQDGDARVRRQADAARRAEARDGRRWSARLDPPTGVTARLAGLQVLGAEANAALSSPLRRLGTLLAGLLAVGLALLLVYRRWERAWVPLVPIALADRLVGARAVRAARAAEPDVGDAGRARDRDLDRVLRAADRALPRGAGGRRTSPRRRCGAPTARPARR